MTLTECFRPGVIIVLHPSVRRIGALVRAKDLDKAALLRSVVRCTAQGSEWEPI